MAKYFLKMVLELASQPNSRDVVDSCLHCESFVCLPLFFNSSRNLRKQPGVCCSCWFYINEAASVPSIGVHLVWYSPNIAQDALQSVHHFRARISLPVKTKLLYQVSSFLFSHPRCRSLCFREKFIDVHTKTKRFFGVFL